MSSLNVSLGHLLRSWYTKLPCCPHFCMATKHGYLTLATSELLNNINSAHSTLSWQDRTTNASTLNRHAPSALRPAWLKLSYVGLGMSSARHKRSKAITLCPTDHWQTCYRGQQKLYKVQMKTNMKKCNIDTTTWGADCENRVRWRSIFKICVERVCARARARARVYVCVRVSVRVSVRVRVRVRMYL